MRIRAANIVLALLVALGVCRAQSSHTGEPLNGFWWQGQSVTVKVWYVRGFVDAITQARSTAKVHFLEGHSGKPLSKDEQALLNTFGFTNIRYGQFTGGLDDFYKDYRNSSIHVDDAMFYVRDTLSSTPEQLLKDELGMLQKDSHESWYDQQ